MTPTAPWGPREQQIYRLITASTAPVWLAMLLAPRSAVTARVVRLGQPLGVALGAGYLGLLASTVGRGERVSFADGDSVRQGLLAPRGFLAAWAHMVSLDLVTGEVLWRRGLQEGRDTRVALVAAWFAGPSGLVVDAAARRLAARPRPHPHLPVIRADPPPEKPGRTARITGGGWRWRWRGGRP